MPRTIESILTSHRAASERRAVGKSPWDRRIRIKHLLTDDDSDEGAQQTGRQIALVLRKSDWLAQDQKSSRERSGDSEVQLATEEFEEIEDLDGFNAVLDHLYDLADADRVWVG